MSTTDKPTWQLAEKICEVPSVDEAIRTFVDDNTADNAIGMVLAVLEYQAATEAAKATGTAGEPKLTDMIDSKGRPKIAPVQGYAPGIPWSLHLEAYDAYRKRYGKQDALIDLEGRECRGGFGTGELDMFIPGWRDKVSEIGQLKARIAELEAAARQPAPVVAVQRWQDRLPLCPSREEIMAHMESEIGELRTVLSGYQQAAEPDWSRFKTWLAQEMPAGTVIGDPAWWAPRIFNAVGFHAIAATNRSQP